MAALAADRADRVAEAVDDGDLAPVLDQPEQGPPGRGLDVSDRVQHPFTRPIPRETLAYLHSHNGFRRMRGRWEQGEFQVLIQMFVVARISWAVRRQQPALGIVCRTGRPAVALEVPAGRAQLLAVPGKGFLGSKGGAHLEFRVRIAKAGIDNLTRWMAVEMASKFGDGVRVNAVAPGFFVADQNRAVLLNPDGSYTKRAQTVIAKTPMGRFGSPDELNGAVQWLCSDAASFVTGTVIPIDGGFSAFSGV